MGVNDCGLSVSGMCVRAVMNTFGLEICSALSLPVHFCLSWEEVILSRQSSGESFVSCTRVFFLQVTVSLLQQYSCCGIVHIYRGRAIS